MTDTIKALADAAREVLRQRTENIGHVGGILTLDQAVNLFLALSEMEEALAAYDAAHAQPKAVPGTNSLEPIVYHLEDGKLARGMRIGRSAVSGESTIVVDLTFGDGPSVIGRDDWFQRGYVECYGGLVPETASEGTEPGQWSYGVLKCNREIDAAQAQPAPTEAEIESAVVEFGSAKFWQGEAMWSPTDITEDGELLDRRSLEAKANLLFLIARLRGGAR